MFCPIERVELVVNYCPAKTCMYKGQNRQCEFNKLTKDEVTAYDIADVHGVKAYKAKAQLSIAKDHLTKGMIAWKYSEYIQDSFPVVAQNLGEEGSQTVNGGEDHMFMILLKVFGLTRYQQDKFWDATRYAAWSERNGITKPLSDLQAVLSQIKPDSL